MVKVSTASFVWHRLQKFQCGRERKKGVEFLSPFVNWDAVTFLWVGCSPSNACPCYYITLPYQRKCCIVNSSKPPNNESCSFLGRQATAHEEPRAVCWYKVFAMMSFHSTNLCSASGVLCQIRSSFFMIPEKACWINHLFSCNRGGRDRESTIKFSKPTPLFVRTHSG